MFFAKKYINKRTSLHQEMVLISLKDCDLIRINQLPASATRWQHWPLTCFVSFVKKVVMLSVIMLNVVMLGVVMLNVVAPSVKLGPF
jgi:hypothetical protein